MKNFNLKIALILAFLSISLFSSLEIKAQSFKIDSNLLKFYLTKLDTILVYQSKWNQNTFLFQELSKGFCFLQNEEKTKADEILSLCLNPSFLHPYEINFFLQRNFKCFDDGQRTSIRNNLSQFLEFSDPFFHELVSSFQIASKSDYLKEHLFTKNLFEVINIDLNDGKLDELYKIEMKNMATLANLGYTQMEDSLLLGVNELYKHIKQSDKKKLILFYQEIIPNSIALLYSKRSVLETLYMIDEEEKSPFESYDDVADLGYSFNYFFTSVQPKLKDWKVEDLAWSGFDKNKDKIKEIIINDNSIWLDHIRIEDK